MSTVHYRGSGVQIEISGDDCASNRVHRFSRFFRSFGTFGARQQVLFEWRKLGFVSDHSKVIAFKIVIGNVVHASIVVRPGKILREKIICLRTSELPTG